MKPTFRLVALSVDQFVPLFNLSDDALVRQGIQRRTADADSGYPCRVSLVDSKHGERVLLLPFTHQTANSPYHSSGAIFVREQAVRATPEIGEVPDSFRHRLLSVRAYDAADMMIDAEITEGTALETSITRLFDNMQVNYLHLHNAKPGCFACRVDRV